MMLIEQTTVPQAVLPIAEFRDHLRLGTGFVDDGGQDALLERVLRAALSAIEARTGKVTISRDFIWSLSGWRDTVMQALPVAPVNAISSLSIQDQGGNAIVIAASAYALIKDSQRPYIRATGNALPTIPAGGMAEIGFQAGYGAQWDALPEDLTHAVMLLAAHYYEFRHEAAMPSGSMPHGVNALIQPYRTVRVLGGR